MQSDEALDSIKFSRFQPLIPESFDHTLIRLNRKLTGSRDLSRLKRTVLAIVEAILRESLDD